MTREIPTILFGAFDRHNFGDLLFPHIVAALLKRKNLLYAGLAERDLRACDGHQVQALAQLVSHWSEQAVNIIHVGGELLTCDAWEAAVMLLPPEQAQAAIVHFDGKPREKAAWAQRVLRLASLAPYTMPQELFPCAASVIYNAVGGADLDKREPALRTEIVCKLRKANAVGVRDKTTQACLHAEGIHAQLLPDPAVMVAELFGTVIRQQAQTGEVAQVLRSFPNGYIAMQFSTDFDDDDSLNRIASQLDQAARSSGLGVALFRAGAAPWHDDLKCYQRLAARLSTAPVRIFTSLKIWDICALIACSRAYIGSSLHGRIVAMAFALPRVNLIHPAQAIHIGKQAAFAQTWETACMPTTVVMDNIADGLHDAMAADRDQLKYIAAKLVAEYRQGFHALCRPLK